jgi:Janus kinase 2
LFAFAVRSHEKLTIVFHSISSVQWLHVSKFADFYTIQIDEHMHQVSLEIQNSPDGFPITMTSKAEIESFVSCLNGYYRLMVKWNMDLCASLASPTLKFLSDLKIHGPIGGAFSYSKIEEKNQSVGSFIVRQCEKAFDTFYIDIVTKENVKPETFKILYISSSSGNRWQLCVGENERQDFDDLIDLAKSIPAGTRYFRLPPTQHDRSELLLLCRPRSSLMVELTSNVRHSNPVLLRALDDLLLHKFSQKEWGDGVFTRMGADLKQPTGKKIQVTMKILKPSEVERRQGDFLKLADKWVKVDLSEIVKMHGLTLCQPTSLVMESIKVGPLDEFLRNPKHKKDIRTADLVETAYSLAKALHYLVRERNISQKAIPNSLKLFLPPEYFSKKTKSSMAAFAVQPFKSCNLIRTESSL